MALKIWWGVLCYILSLLLALLLCWITLWSLPSPLLSYHSVTWWHGSHHSAQRWHWWWWFYAIKWVQRYYPDLQWASTSHNPPSSFSCSSDPLGVAPPMCTTAWEDVNARAWCRTWASSEYLQIHSINVSHLPISDVDRYSLAFCYHCRFEDRYIWVLQANNSHLPIWFHFSHRSAHSSHKSWMTWYSYIYICSIAHSCMPAALGYGCPGMSGCAQRWASTIFTIISWCSGEQNTLFAVSPSLTSSFTESAMSSCTLTTKRLAWKGVHSEGALGLDQGGSMQCAAAFGALSMSPSHSLKS